MRLTLCFLLSILFFACETTKEYIYKGSKIKGLSFVAPHKEIGDSVITKVTDIHADWISIMPYAFVKNGTSKVEFSKSNDKKHQWWGETPEGVISCIKMAHDKNLKIMMKPHLWLGNGSFTGDLAFTSEHEWVEFEETYKEYILSFAKLAELNKVEMFCIGTELENFVEERPEYWQKLIKEIRIIYKGKLTYAENWDCYSKVRFWNDLDFIGVDAYFPLSDKKDPDIKHLNNAWLKHVVELKKFSNEKQLPILFTEIGYRSCDFSTQKPWDTDFSLPPNETLQNKAFVAFKESVYNQNWFAGLFIWKWFPIEEKQWPGHHKELFSPQNKPALSTIKAMFES